MKVYFTASVRGKKFYEDHYEKIYESIHNLGYQHVDKLLFSTSVQTFYKSLETGGQKTYVDFYNKTLLNIKTADINIFECSFPSLGVGFQVEKSLEFGKPTVVLYLKDHIPHFIAGTNSDKLILKMYNDKNVNQVVKESLEEAKRRTDKRFNFFISPYLLNYLQNTSKKLGVTKSTFIRTLILEHIKRSAQYHQ